MTVYFSVYVVGLWSCPLLTSLGASVHFVVEGGLILMSLLLAFAGATVMGEVLGDAMRPAVGDGLAFFVVSLGDFDFVAGFGLVA